jgi:hypothetical protein
MSIIKKKSEPSSNKNLDEGFALTQILILSIALGIGITALLASSILRLTSSKINTLEINSRNASYSAISNLRSLFNNTKGVYHYFWLAKACSANATNIQRECPSFNPLRDRHIWPGILNQGSFPDLSRLYWTDAQQTWCNGRQGCFGRQVAPVCTYTGTLNGSSIGWNSYINSLDKAIDNQEDYIGHSVSNTIRDSLQSYFIKSTNFVGTEHGGENSILVEGFTRANQTQASSPMTSNNKIRVNIGISKIVPDSGFAFISAGENELDTNSLYLGNFNVMGDKTGSIVWRKNIYRNTDCINLRNNAGSLNNAGLPDNTKNKGGIWVQPLLLPGTPNHQNSSTNAGNSLNLGSVFCTPSNSGSANSKCRTLNDLTRGGTRNGKILIDNLFVQGDGAIFSVVTDRNNPITLEVSGDIEISNYGKLCHRSSASASCGSGSPENLTIIFSQPNVNKQEVACSWLGGMDLTSGTGTANNTFVLGSTGRSSNEKFTGFIYSADTTFSTSNPLVPYYQNPNNNYSNRQIVVSKGAYGIVENPFSNSNQDKNPVLISLNGRNIPFTSHTVAISNIDPLGGWKIIATGKRQPGLANTTLDPMNDVLLLASNPGGSGWIYKLQGIYYDSSSGKYQISTSNRNGKSYQINLGRNLLLQNSNGIPWVQYYGIDWKQKNLNLTSGINIDGIAWVKNLCLDHRHPTYWTFDTDTQEDLIERYSEAINYGVPYYRGKVITAWDTLRDFDN